MKNLKTLAKYGAVVAVASLPVLTNAAPLDLTGLATSESDAIANIGAITLIGLGVGLFAMGARKAIKVVNRV